ncbi:Hexaprenyldihydroxybenzoate methyltransferase, mitochondrial [Neurospora sp. IMI 360204]|nr:Hexaprenyldihydroxybenzoate methyltransferase, mitochondrial [Neurospora sp. IMI 360204]
MLPSSPLRKLAPTIARRARKAQSIARLASTPQCSAPTTPSPSATTQRWHSNHSSGPSSSSSVNPDEISHFNALAATWWDPHGSSRALHLMNPLRHDFIQTCRSSSPTSSFTVLTEDSNLPPSSDAASTSNTSNVQELRYLDIGCGGGIFAESAARLPTTSSVLAIDPSPGVLAIARSHAKKDPSLSPKLTYLSSTIESLPTLRPEAVENKFDVVSCFEVIEHVDHPALFLDHVAQFVKPGGWLVMSTIARTWTSWFTTNFMAEDVLGIVPKGTHDWNKYINEYELRGYFEETEEKRRFWGRPRAMGVVYVPGLGWKEVPGSEKVGNYFLGVQRLASEDA